MKKLSEIVDFINTGGRYLVLGQQDYFCYVLMDLRCEGLISIEDCDDLLDLIRESIDYKAYLQTYLVLKGVIPYGLGYLSGEYKAAAHAHWATLADKLRAEGK